MAGTERLEYDVVVLGGGLAGLTLARHLLLETERTVLLLDRRAELPPARQKVGEATVQVGGHYLAKVLDLEAYLLSEHFMKYNLRFYWKSTGRSNDRLEHYHQAYIRNFSNVASYQLDRNRIEAELLRRNLESPRFRLVAPALRIATEIHEEAAPGARHRARYAGPRGEEEVACSWLVDATGRARLLAKRKRLDERNAIRHGASFAWVDGQVEVEKLTERSRREIRLDPARAATGHLPHWLATCHFAGEGFWLWLIPLRGKTSLGLVYDHRVLDHDRVSSGEKLIAWVCEEFPLLARDLPGRRLLDWSAYHDFSYGCAHTIHPDRWALVGEAGRFSDPLYSPGTDLIAIHNTLLVDAIETGPEDDLRGKCKRYETLQRAVYEAYLPSYSTSYDALGDQETFVLKYVWELTIYFGFYVFPFLNELFTDRRFLATYFRRFAKLGELNRRLQQLLSAYYQWKKGQPAAPAGDGTPAPILFELTDLAPLEAAQQTFYRIGVSVEEARSVLDEQLANLEELAGYIVAAVYAAVAGDASLRRDQRLVQDLDLGELAFDEAAILEHVDARRSLEGARPWSFDPGVLAPFDRARPTARATTASAGAGQR